MIGSERMTNTKSSKRTALLKDLADAMTSHEIFSDNVGRDDSERTIQKALFLRLEKSLLPDILEKHKLVPKTRMDEFLERDFIYEQDKKTVVSHWNTFGTNHRPDAILKFKDFKACIELKVAKNGAGLRGGIGQAVLFSYDSALTLYVVVDATPNKSIVASFNNDKEQAIVDSLWQNYNCKFVVV